MEDLLSPTRGGRLSNGPLLTGNYNPAFSREDDLDRRLPRSDNPSGGDDENDLDRALGSLDDHDDEGSSGRATHEEDSSNLSQGRDSRAGDFDDLEEDLPDKNWDVFEETAWENLAHADRRFWARVNAVSRVVLCLFLFLLITFASCLSTMVFLVIGYNINSAGQNFTLPGGQVLKLASDVVNVRWVWAAIMMTTAPYFFTLVSCLFKLCVKRTRDLMIKPLLTALAVETVHSIGLGVFVFLVAPAYDPLMVILLGQGVALVPALLRIYRVKRSKQENQSFEDIRWSWLNFSACVLTLVFLGLVAFRLYEDDIVLPVAIPVSLALLSVEWWENFVPVKDAWKRLRRRENREMRKFKRTRSMAGRVEQKTFEAGSFLFRAKYAIRERRTKIEAVCMVWKIFLNLVIPMAIFASNGSTDCVSALYFTADSAHDCSLWGDGLDSSGSGWCDSYLPFVVAAVGIGASGLAYKAAKVACKIHAQRMCFALPFLLSAPLTFIMALVTYRDPFIISDCPQLQWPLLAEDKGLLWLLDDYTRGYWLPLIFVGLLLVGFTSNHVWTPSAERVASTDKLFVRPLYCGVMFVQSMLLNRAVDDTETGQSASTSHAKQMENWTVRMEEETVDSEQRVEEEMKRSSIPRIYACATMWHETRKEMAQLLKSLFRMDSDQFTRACMWKRFNIVDRDFYMFEAHIFFDDAFAKSPGSSEPLVNNFVKTLLSVVDEAARAIYPDTVSLEPPKKMETPYGGRLTYNLPGGNPLVIHLKNREQIRHKKRWSQVMYMYYLLSYRLLLNKGSSTEKRRLADNTFLLALDGDVDFYPDAVQLLVDRMRRNHHVGAACGRIHPIGSGVMVWYQKFEYAVSHWLQKAAEHVFGCVLCSPGCFSLFRGSALMEDNVLKRYTKVAERARHAVQYDMGEDRWLCTLLLQQGKRVEYAAAADALTFCPDDFGDFYIQRRRWTPSTMANILDVLSDWRHITKVNSSVSLMFIAYQTFLFVSSVLTPGTIFLLILGAINTAYPTLPLYGAMLLNLIPVLIFIILCFVAKTEIQIAYATILSMLYSLVMMIVLVGLLRQMAESGMCSVTAIFFVGVAGIFLIAAFLHPQEFLNILFGLLYFLAIPATSMLLIFFAVANLNVVSWGTRDSGPASGGNKKKKTTFQGVKRMLSGAGGDDEDVTSDYTFSFGNLFRCICCPVKKSDDPVMERFGDIENALYELQQTVSERSGRGSERDRRDAADMGPRSMHVQPGNLSYQVGDRQTRNPLFRDDDEDLDVFSKSRQDTDFPKMWFEEEELGSGIMDTLPHEESVFWNELIEKYLKPIPRDPQKEAAMANDLTKLRNKAAMLFFLGNALFVTIIFILESVAEYTPGLTIELPCDTGHVGQKLEPISVTFTIIFGILLVLQLFGMLQHRFSTFVHIVASTSLRSQKRGSESENYALNKRNYFYDLTVNFVQPGGVWDDDSRSYLTPGSSWDGSSLDGARSQDTASQSGRGGRRLMANLVRRQTTKNRAEPTKTLQDVADDRLLPVLSEIKKIKAGEATRDGERGDTDSEASSKEAADRQNQQPVIPNGLRWLKGQSMKAVLSLAREPELLQLAQTRAKNARKNWQTAKKKLVSAVPRQQGFADIVKRVQENPDLVSIPKSGESTTEDTRRKISVGFQEPATATGGAFGTVDEQAGASAPLAAMPPTKAKNRWMKAQAWTASGGMSAFLTTERPTSHTELKTLAEVYTDPDKKEAADKEEGADHVGDDHAGDATSRDKFSEDEEEEEEEAETYF